VFVWIDDTMIWWYNQGPPDMPWASFCIPGTPWTPIIHAAPINDYDIVVNGGGSTSKRTGHKLRVRVRAQVTGWHNLAGANPFFLPIPIPIWPAICSWEWSIGIYPTGGTGGKTTD
ncbi:MAG: hypothetical protein ACXADC_17565, partial [Candidatus Thorarchaeota archaeon]